MRLGRAGWWVAWVVLVFVRLWQLVVLDYSNCVGAVLLIVEGMALILGVVNTALCKRRDYRLAGLITPACYLLGFILFPRVGALTGASLVACVVSLCLSTISLFYLNVRFTVGSASWVSLVDRGPYSVIRHPQSLARVVLIAAVAFAPGVDLLRLFLCLLCSVAVVLTEEGSLVGVPEWRKYAGRVRYRLVPGVW